MQKIIQKIRTVLDHLDIGGEQSRQFAEEIRLLQEILEDLESPGPSKDHSTDCR